MKKIDRWLRCRKPSRQEFVRVRPGEQWRLETAVFEDKTNREIYLVEPRIAGELAGEIIPVCLFMAINRQADLFLWPAKLPGPDGRPNTWNESALAAAAVGRTKWIRMAANMATGAYDVFEATGDLAEPEWPELIVSPDSAAVFQGSVHSI